MCRFSPLESCILIVTFFFESKIRNQSFPLTYIHVYRWFSLSYKLASYSIVGVPLPHEYFSESISPYSSDRIFFMTYFFSWCWSPHCYSHVQPDRLKQQINSFRHYDPLICQRWMVAHHHHHQNICFFLVRAYSRPCCRLLSSWSLDTNAGVSLYGHGLITMRLDIYGRFVHQFN